MPILKKTLITLLTISPRPKSLYPHINPSKTILNSVSALTASKAKITTTSESKTGHKHLSRGITCTGHSDQGLTMAKEMTSKMASMAKIQNPGHPTIMKISNNLLRIITNKIGIPNTNKVTITITTMEGNMIIKKSNNHTNQTFKILIMRHTTTIMR